jgi:broad specificity phosphatase PhoE
LVRHGQAAAGWGDDPDPGLSPTGRAQAESVAAALAPHGPLPVITSPLRRTRETAAALESTWGVTAAVEPAVGEIPSAGMGLAERADWLRGLMRTPMAEWPEDLQSWRTSIRDRLAAIGDDTVVVSHFMAIRSVVEDDAYLPDHCSLTVLDGMRLAQPGRQLATKVL